MVDGWKSFALSYGDAIGAPRSRVGAPRASVRPRRNGACPNSRHVAPSRERSPLMALACGAAPDPLQITR